jgi:glycopeptide antibiotics resistance protein
MFHRHPFLSLVTGAYVVLVGWVTLTPASGAPSWEPRAQTVLDRFHAHHLLLWMNVNRLEFLANVGMFVPIGLFLLLLFGTRLWWVAIAAGFALTSAIELAQRSIPGRVSDPRDVVANTGGAVIGVLIGLVLTFPSSMRRRRARLAAAQRSAAVPVRR